MVVGRVVFQAIVAVSDAGVKRTSADAGRPTSVAKEDDTPLDPAQGLKGVVEGDPKKGDLKKGEKKVPEQELSLWDRLVRGVANFVSNGFGSVPGAAD